MKIENASLEFGLVARMIEDGHLSDAASELTSVGPDEKRVLMTDLLSAACDEGDHDLVRRVCLQHETKGQLPPVLVERMHALADEHEVGSDFHDAMPTLVMDFTR